MSTQPDYQVFLSFRGLDTRRNFADFLYTSLTDVGIRVFKDEEELERGEEIRPQLIQAIEQSKISIPIISRDYGSSKSCLMELEQMLKCKDNNESHIIIPIFYYVDPSDVRHRRGSFGRSLRGHKRNSDGIIIDSWTSALCRIGQLKGHHLQEKNEKPLGELIKKIVCEVEQNLKTRDLDVPKQLVGVDPHVQEIKANLKVDYRDGQAKIGDTCEKVLIHGIPGVGKTVLAKYVYNQLHHLFDACSFLQKIQEEIRDHDMVFLQNRLISHLHKGNAREFDLSDHALKHIQERFRPMKVLLLLDDVEDQEQLSALVGELDWLGPGSRVIVTSRRCDVLRKVNGAESYALGSLKEDKALTLFCKHALNTDSPPENFRKLATDIVAATDGLPSALENVGKFLFEKDKNVWKEKLIQLKKAPDKSVQEALFKSYTTLADEAQQIFLDIACFFNGMDKRIPCYMWDNCDYFPYTSILSLHAMSLVEIGENKELRMCGILKTFGREIVKRENKKEPCQRSRLWNHKEALDVLTGRKGTKKVEALGLECGDPSDRNISLGCDQFDGLWNLRFLKLHEANIQGNFGDHFLRLMWLDWQESLRIFKDYLNLNLENLVILGLSGSQFDEKWRGWDLLEKARKLKVLKLTGCVEMTSTPEFPDSIKLERLILEGCSKLASIREPYNAMKELVSLNIKGCSLHEMPWLDYMKSLKELVIDGTSISVINFKEVYMGRLKTLSARDCKSLTDITNWYPWSLKYLALDGSRIRTLGESIKSLEKLQILSLKNCRSLSDLPYGIGKLRSLQSLDLSGTVIEELPSSVKDLKAMKVLRMRGTFIQEFPKAILNLDKLEEIDFSLCQRLEGRIDCDIGTLSSLAILKLTDTQISALPPSISCLSRLRELHISRCHNLQSLPELPFFVNVFKDSGD